MDEDVSNDCGGRKEGQGLFMGFFIEPAGAFGLWASMIHSIKEL
jgi:hypothetical protein